jgi:hypothetical protein
MSEQTPWWISLIVAWLPFVFFLVSFSWVVGRPLRRGLFTKDGRSLADVIAELTNELRRLDEKPK